MPWIERLAAPGRARRLLVPLLGGLLLALAHPPWRLWPLVFVAWTPLWLALADAARPAAGGASRRRGRLGDGFLQGWLMGTSGYLLMLHWILRLPNEEMTIPGLMIPGLLLLAAHAGLFHGAAAAGAVALSRWSGWPLPLAAAPLFTLVEWLRGLGVLGFPWGAAGYALARVPPLLQSSALVGFWGLVFLILLVNAFLALGLRGRRWGVAAALLAFGALWFHGAHELAAHEPGRLHAGRRPLRLLVAQPDIGRDIKWRPEKRALVFERAFTHAYAAADRGMEAGGFDLFLWPETALPTLLYMDPETIERVVTLVDRMRRPLLMGTEEIYEDWGTERWQQGAYNSAVAVHPGGRLSDPYRKVKLVPFSERMPLQKIAPWITGLDFGQSNFFPGAGPVLFPIGEERVGCLICFESAFPEVARQMVREGATVLVNITNDFWFGRSAGPIQHAEMAVLRAVENRVPVVRCANTGISFAVDPWGRVSHETGLFTQADFVAAVGAGSGSFASRHPDWFLALPAGACAAAIAWGALRAAARRRR